MPEVDVDAPVYVDPYSVESIAIGLERILSSPTLRSNLAKKGLRNATRFSWDQAAKQTFKVFKSTISK
jgi:alpha-1,3-rhamnosyl/mannosyltransferase